MEAECIHLVFRIIENPLFIAFYEDLKTCFDESVGRCWSQSSTSFELLLFAPQPQSWRQRRHFDKEITIANERVEVRKSLIEMTLHAIR
jgi:hypothetical protein